jgi:hypothetical protein
VSHDCWSICFSFFFFVDVDVVVVQRWQKRRQQQQQHQVAGVVGAASGSETLLCKELFNGWLIWLGSGGVVGCGYIHVFSQAQQYKSLF